MNSNIPSYEQIRKMHMEQGLPWRAIGTKCKCDYTVIYNKAKRTALRRKDPWPWVRTFSAKTCRPAAHARHDCVDTTLVVMEIREFCTQHTMTFKHFAHEVGVCPSYLYNIIAPSRPRKYIARTKAQLFVDYIKQAEDAEAASARPLHR